MDNEFISRASAAILFFRIRLAFPKYDNPSLFWFKEQFLKRASAIQGVYIPSFYEPEYHEDCTLKALVPKYDFVPETVKKRVVADLDSAYFPETFVVPFSEIVTDTVASFEPLAREQGKEIHADTSFERSSFGKAAA